MPLAVVDRTCHAQEVARCCGCTALFFPYTMHTVRPPTRLMYVCPIRCVTRCPHDSALDLITPLVASVLRKCSMSLALRVSPHLGIFAVQFEGFNSATIKLVAPMRHTTLLLTNLVVLLLMILQRMINQTYMITLERILSTFIIMDIVSNIIFYIIIIRVIDITETLGEL
ncbi:hypothetical protein QTP88_015129 [Uroleucon formosanum]